MQTRAPAERITPVKYVLLLLRDSALLGGATIRPRVDRYRSTLHRATGVLIRARFNRLAFVGQVLVIHGDPDERVLRVL